MPHVNEAIEKVCRICHATAPKASIKKIQIFHSNFFLIPFNRKECICQNCLQKYENYKNSSFSEVKIYFGYLQDQHLPEVTNCSSYSKCIYCSELDRWRVVETMPESKEKRKAEREFFRQLIDVNSTTIALTPLTVKDEPQPGFYRIEYRQLKTHFIYCKPCDKILNFTHSNNRGLRSHQASQEHGKNESPQIPNQPMDIVADSPSQRRKLTKQELSKIQEIIAVNITPKHSAYYLESESFNNPMKQILGVADVYVPDGQSLTGSRQSLLRLAKEKSIQITNQTNNEIAIANQQNSHIVITMNV